MLGLVELGFPVRVILQFGLKFNPLQSFLASRSELQKYGPGNSSNLKRLAQFFGGYIIPPKECGAKIFKLNNQGASRSSLTKSITTFVAQVVWWSGPGTEPCSLIKLV
tara:strand:+ start:465 stop:788 length:324 start_codon:yes stop_codon:yes gene_type:complete